MNIDDVITTRAATHGPFEVQAEIAQKLKDLIASYSGYTMLNPIQREALDMVLHKVSRIVCGNPNVHDHWVDIAGYAKLAADRIKG